MGADDSRTELRSVKDDFIAYTQNNTNNILLRHLALYVKWGAVWNKYKSNKEIKIINRKKSKVFVIVGVTVNPSPPDIQPSSQKSKMPNAKKQKGSVCVFAFLQIANRKLTVLSFAEDC